MVSLDIVYSVIFAIGIIIAIADGIYEIRNQTDDDKQHIMHNLLG